MPEDIANFAKSKGAEWPIFAKSDVNGPDSHPLYQFMKRGKFSADIGWNFEYFLISKQGNVVERWPTGTELLSPPVIATIEKELAKRTSNEKKMSQSPTSSTGAISVDDIALPIIAVVCIGLVVAFGRTSNAKGKPTSRGPKSRKAK